MKQMIGEFVAAVRDALTARHFRFDAAIAVGQDPDDGGERVELHVFDVPTFTRRDVETDAITLLLEVEDRLPDVSSIACVYTSALTADGRAAITARSAVRYAPYEELPPVFLSADLSEVDGAWAAMDATPTMLDGAVILDIADLRDGVLDALYDVLSPPPELTDREPDATIGDLSSASARDREFQSDVEIHARSVMACASGPLREQFRDDGVVTLGALSGVAA